MSKTAEMNIAALKRKPTLPAKGTLPSLLSELLMLFVKITSIVAILIALFTFVFGVFPSRELVMDPTIKDGDMVVYYRHNKDKYSSQDVVVLKHEGIQHVRRVVATAGDAVDITEHGLLVNGALQQELNIVGKTFRYEEGIDFPLTVPPNMIFVLADHRQEATDSRIYGCVAIKETMGKVIALIRLRRI